MHCTGNEFNEKVPYKDQGSRETTKQTSYNTVPPVEDIVKGSM